MFNENQKRRYLDGDSFRFDEGTKEVAERIFSTLSEAERQKGEDLSTFLYKDVVDLLKSVNSRSKNYLRLISKFCFEYTNWCKIEGYISNKAINFYDYSIIKEVINDLVPLSLVEDKYFKKEYILDTLNLIPDSSNKFLLYAPFVGVCGVGSDNMRFLKYSDINESEKTVTLHDGKIVKIDDVFIKLAKEANESTEYSPEGINNLYNTESDPKWLSYNESCYILKTAGKIETYNQEVSRQFLLSRYSFIQKQVDNKFITATNLYKNGIINYIKQRFEERGISLRQGFFEMRDRQSYMYTEDLKEYINDFGSSINERQLRAEMKEFIDLYE
jgi:hypothetical protein